MVKGHFILVDAFRFLVFYFHLDRKITENLFPVTENIFLKENCNCATCATAWTLANINNYLNIQSQTREKLPSYHD